MFGRKLVLCSSFILASFPCLALRTDLVFTSLSEPCRIIDTRVPASPLVPGAPRHFLVAGSTGFLFQGGNSGGCGIPTTATVAMINFVAVNPQGGGNLRASAYPALVPATGSILNYQLLNPNLNIANGLLFPICDRSAGSCEADISVLANGAGVHLVADVLGYSTPDHKHDGSDITTGTVDEARIDTAITRDTEVVPTVLAGDGAGSGLDADLIDGLDSSSFATSSHHHDDAYQTKYRRTVVVSPAGTETENGAALLAALDGITDASASKQYLLKIEPGTYALGASPLVMIPYVDVEGSGESTTLIRGKAFSVADGGTVIGSANSELRFVTLENTGGNAVGIAFYVASTTARLRHVTLKAHGATENVALYSSFATLDLSDITVIAEGGNVARGLALYGPDVDGLVHNAVVSASGGASETTGIYSTVGEKVSVKDSTIVVTSGPKTAETFPSAYGLRQSVSPTPPRFENCDITASASAETSAMGVYAEGPVSLLHTNVTAKGSGAFSGCYGILMGISANSPGFTFTAFAQSSSLEAIGCAFNNAVSDFYSDPFVMPTLVATNSKFVGSTNTIVGGDVRVAASQLSGGPTTGPLVKCTFVFDENLIGYPDSCP